MLLCVALLVTGCSTSVDDHKYHRPALNLFSYFDGEVKAWGMLQDRSGKQTRRFSVDILGTVKGNTLTLDEDFVFDDGEKQQRIWTITRHSDGHYSGTAGDVVGEATGKTAGNALNWQYTLRVPVGDTTYEIAFDDWMFLQDDVRMFNVATMSKWGFHVGTVTLFFEKQ
ncbi:DUF3833 domain-containing protein [Photobacterium sp. 1_MG-2023]|uniref:DUF3833 domain-containing protein n=1 Tax=Photobacterium sp. 1_MG-2023 TaxID=3062646 RepID=UPI0026E2AB0F|nr:DUF3833 domain-containing protein [Photobacterium sp. 1_MG-2023]MDO6706974.1 DUF3833 domain-containing protein [Photobacterium sp. 1_MG-2023]